MNHPPGTIIHFSRFRFDGPATATRPAERDKFYVVLRRMGNAIVVACLPSSVDRIPDAVDQVHGCNDYPSGNFTAYMFEALRPITTNGWSFRLRTYMYAFGVREYDERVLATNHPHEGRDYSIKGRLTGAEFVALIDCLQRSIDIKRNMRKALDGAQYDDPDQAGMVSEPEPKYGSAHGTEG
jgi:hypothetical protein